MKRNDETRIRYQLHEKVKPRLKKLYSKEQLSLLYERLNWLVSRYTYTSLVNNPGNAQWDQTNSVLITYGDTVKDGNKLALRTLKAFLDKHIGDAFSAIHILPFFPYSSDDGFSVIDYKKVRKDLGSWNDVKVIGEHYQLVFDLVLNHISQKSEWVQDYVRGIAPARHYFIEATYDEDLSRVVRPRTSPLLNHICSAKDDSLVWTTFSSDQIDLNFANPDVLFEFLEILMYYISQGARIIRLDAIAYLWKKVGTPCIHLPETHEVVKLLRDFVTAFAPETLILTETNVPHHENISYFGNGDEAHLIYQFTLAPLLLYSLQNGDTTYFTQWLGSLDQPPKGCSYLNFTASHDGIGVRPLEGFLSKKEMEQFLEGVSKRGGCISTKKNSDGTESPYELNITYFSALSDPDDKDQDLHINRFLCSQIVAMALKGIPAVYFHSLTGSSNDYDGLKKTERARSINRKQWQKQELEQLLADASTITSRVFNEYCRCLKLRARQTAFHPDGQQNVIDLGKTLLAIERIAPDQKQRLFSISNFTSSPQQIDIKKWLPDLWSTSDLNDLLSGKIFTPSDDIILGPYQTVWLEPQ